MIDKELDNLYNTIVQMSNYIKDIEHANQELHNMNNIAYYKGFSAGVQHAYNMLFRLVDNLDAAIQNMEDDFDTAIKEYKRSLHNAAEN